MAELSTAMYTDSGSSHLIGNFQLAFLLALDPPAIAISSDGSLNRHTCRYIENPNDEEFVCAEEELLAPLRSRGR
jgi:hypothetical protein